MQRNVGTLVIKPLVMTGYTEKKNPRKIYSFTNKDIRLVPCWHWAACRFAFKTTLILCGTDSTILKVLLLIEN